MKDTEDKDTKLSIFLKIHATYEGLLEDSSKPSNIFGAVILD
ncbi:hypothetical protein [Schnuerera sp. xch1]|nr:hypothetical protein [Schnuerera sp. xch1]